jgi:hypothetical protein
MKIELSDEGRAPDVEKHFYLCGCGGQHGPISVLERVAGGHWEWARPRAEHAP